MENIETVKQAITELLLETTTGPNDPNIATTDENLSVDQVYQQTAIPSLGRQIFSVVKINGPTGALFNIRKKSGTNDLELVRAEVEVYPSDPIPTSLTQEAIQDIKSQYGRQADIIIGRLLRGLSNEQENTDTLTFLENNALAVPNLQLTDSLNAQTNLFEIIQKVQELIVKANNIATRGYEAFCVLPYNPGGSISGLTQYVTSNSDAPSEHGLFIGKNGLTSYYLNPNVNSTKAYVGLKHSDNSSRSSAVFAPYTETVIEATDPNNGDVSYHIYNRYAITASPLHDTGNELLFKFDILI